MAKKATRATASSTGLSSDGENTSGYFRKIFAENPKLLKGRSNDALLKRWLKDHSDHSEVPANVKAGLANVKSVLRHKKRKKKKEKVAQEGTAAVVVVAKLKTPRTDLALEHLEEQIDDVLMLARSLERQEVAEVIKHLHRARNAVVWLIGQ